MIDDLFKVWERNLHGSIWSQLQAFIRVLPMCEPASHASQGRAMRAMRAKKRAMRVMAASHASHDCESACESHSYWELTVLKWVLRLNNCLSALFEMGA